MLQEVRNIAAWVVVSTVWVLLTNDMFRSRFLSADLGVFLFVVTLFGVWIAVLAQFGIWVGLIIGVFSKVKAIDRLAGIGSDTHHPEERWLS